MIFLFLVAACNQKDIDYPEDDSPVTLSVRFDWRNAPAADPKGMALFFFTDNYLRGMNWRFDVDGRNGGAVEIPPGRYRLIAVNNDLSAVTFSDIQSFPDFAAEVLPDRESTEPLTNLSYSSGMLFGDAVEFVDIRHARLAFGPDSISAEKPSDMAITCFPDSLSTIYHISCGPIKGAHDIATVKGWLSGPSKKLILSSDQRPGPSVTIPVKFNALSPDIKLEGLCSGFGIPDDNSEFILLLRIYDAYGRHYSKSIPVTTQVLNSSNPLNVFLDVGEVDFSDIVGEDTDFGNPVGVDGWKEEVTDYEMYFP